LSRVSSAIGVSTSAIFYYFESRSSLIEQTYLFEIDTRITEIVTSLTRFLSNNYKCSLESFLESLFYDGIPFEVKRIVKACSALRETEALEISRNKIQSLYTGSVSLLTEMFGLTDNLATELVSTIFGKICYSVLMDEKLDHQQILSLPQFFKFDPI